MGTSFVVSVSLAVFWHGMAAKYDTIGADYANKRRVPAGQLVQGAAEELPCDDDGYDAGYRLVIAR